MTNSVASESTEQKTLPGSLPRQNHSFPHARQLPIEKSLIGWQTINRTLYMYVTQGYQHQVNYMICRTGLNKGERVSLSSE